jgi:hypothetical protein
MSSIDVNLQPKIDNREPLEASFRVPGCGAAARTSDAIVAGEPLRQLAILGLHIELRGIFVVLSIFLTTRLLLLLVIFLSSAVIPMQEGDYGYASPDNLVLDGLIRHDSWWYVDIVEHGYTLGDIKTGQQGTVTFFPLYPLLVKFVAGLTGNIFLAGVLIANAALLAALAFLYGLARDEFDEATAVRAVFYLAAAPSAVFFSAMYTESLFVALVCATFYFARRQNWQMAAAAGALAAATRNTGVLLAAVIALEGLYQQGMRLRPEQLLGASAGATADMWLGHLWRQARIGLKSWRSLMAAAYVLVGLVGYMAFLKFTFGDPLGFVHTQATWGRSTTAAGITRIISGTLANLNIGPSPLAGQINTLTMLNVLSTLGFAPLVVIAILKLRPAYGVYAALTFFIPLSTGTVGSMTRYVLMLVPCFLLLAKWGRHDWVDRLILGIFLPLTSYFAVLFSHWYFVG